MDEEEKEEILKFYKFINKCKKCGIIYGRDEEKESHPNLCVPCRDLRWMNDNEQKAELLKYYDCTSKCKKCGIIYGYDKRFEVHPNLCPPCEDLGGLKWKRRIRNPERTPDL